MFFGSMQASELDGFYTGWQRSQVRPVMMLPDRDLTCQVPLSDIGVLGGGREALW